jgi:hypothetical protein
MTNSDDRTAAPRSRAARKTVLFGFLTLIGGGAAATLPITAAHAQYLPAPWSYPYYDGYPPPLPPGRVAAEEGDAEYARPDTSYGVLPPAEIRRRVASLGFHLIAVPRHKDRIYLAEAEDAHGLRHRLVFDAYQGNIIENTKLTAKKDAKKELQAKSAAVTPAPKASPDADPK